MLLTFRSPMKRRFHLPVSIFYLLTSLAVASGAHAQGGGGVIGKTDLGKSQNTSEDLMNSLIVPPKSKVDKHEKKEEVDPKKLTSKKSTDNTFSGSLNDIGLDWNGNKMGKPHVTSDGDSKPARQSEASAEKDAKPAKSSEPSVDGQNKELKATTARTEKSSDKEKTAAAKTDDQH